MEMDEREPFLWDGLDTDQECLHWPGWSCEGMAECCRLLPRDHSGIACCLHDTDD
jgi:hypothetical protein